MIIRKIAVGSDYKNNAMHYMVGQAVLGGHFKVCEIRKGASSVMVFVLKGEDGSGEIFLWKEFNDTMPMTIEYNLEFE
jgi:hypothetical protein